jgi:gliding motility-associatede transport system auxiliary component
MRAGESTFMRASPQAQEAIEYTRRRRFATWLNAGLMTVFLAGTVVMVNVIAREHAARFNWTADKIEQLLPETEQRLKGIDRDFGILLNPMDTGAQAADRSLPEAWRLVRHMLVEFERQNPRIKVTVSEEGQPPPAWLQEFGRNALRPNELYLYCRGVDLRPSMRVFDVRELYTGDPATGEIEDFRAEMKLISAMWTMVNAERKVVYFTEGHNETRVEERRDSGQSAIVQFLRERDNVEFRRLSLSASRGVPQDADAVYVTGPRIDFQPEELDLLGEYLDEGGRLFVSIEPLSRTPLLDRFLLKWGARAGRDVILDKSAVRDTRVLRVRSFGTHEVASGLTGTDMYVDVPITAALRPAPSPDGRLRYSWLMRSSVESCEDLNKNGRLEPEELKGPLDIAAAVQGPDSEKPRQRHRPAPKLIVFGSTQVFSNAYTVRAPAWTMGLYLNAWRWLLELERVVEGGAKRTIRVKPVDLGDKGKRQVLWVTVGGMPMLGIVLGIFAWWSRRK